MAIGFAIIAIFVLVFICYSSSALIFNKLGKSGSKVVSSLSAFILLAIGVSVIWSGIQILLASVGHGQVFAAKRGVAPHF